MRTREDQEKEKPTSLTVLLANEQYRHGRLRKAIDTLILDWRTNDGSDKSWIDIRHEFADKLEAARAKASP